MRQNNPNISDSVMWSLRDEVSAQQIPAVNAKTTRINSGERERSCCCLFCNLTFQTFTAGSNLQAILAVIIQADDVTVIWVAD